MAPSGSKPWSNNRQLGSTLANQRERQLDRWLGRRTPPDGKGMGDSANSDVVRRLFLPDAPDQPVQRSKIPCEVNGIPFVPGSGNLDLLPPTNAG